MQVWSQMAGAGAPLGRLTFGSHIVYFHWMNDEGKVHMAFTVVAQDQTEPYTGMAFYYEVLKRLWRDPDYRCAPAS